MSLTRTLTLVGLLLGAPSAATAAPSVELQLTLAPALPAWLLASEAAPAVGSTTEVRTTVFGLPQNMGPVDRIARGVIAAGLIGLGSYGLASENFSPAASGVLLGVSVIPLLTAATGYCPLYHLFGIDETF